MLESLWEVSTWSTATDFALALRRTNFSHLEELVRIPAYNTSLQSAPAPFRNTRNHLAFCQFSFHAMLPGGELSNHGLRHAEFLRQRIATNGLGMVEKVSDKGAHSARVGGRSEWEKEEGQVEGCRATRFVSKNSYPMTEALAGIMLHLCAFKPVRGTYLAP